MKILAVSDTESPALWDHFLPGRLDPYDLILACGDLKAAYLTFLVTMSHARLLYVHGNHDAYLSSHPPEGCEDIDGHLIEYCGVRILGLGGCLRYHEGPYQYTEKQMMRRVRALRRAIKKANGIDIVITHAPPRGLGDLEDPAHRGFEAFRELIEEFRPAYLLHGHTHLNYGNAIPRETVYGDTRIINVSERFELDLPVPADRSAEPKWYTKRPREADYADMFNRLTLMGSLEEGPEA